MYAVGRLGSYISRSVYSVSAPFHAFGGAVDIIVVEQSDGSFKSLPWYVRFGKFQGVLKTREKVVTINVNGDFNMFLDHTGEAYFLCEVDGYDWESEAVSFPFPSGYESDDPSCANRRPLKSFSCNYDGGMLNSVEKIDVSKGKIFARTSSQGRMLGHVLGKSMEKDGGSVMRLDSLERAEIAAGVLETNWSTNIFYDSSNENASAETLSFEQSQFQSFANDKGENDLCRTSSPCEGFMEGKSEVIANISGGIDGSSVGNSHLQCQLKLEECEDEQFDGEPADNEKNAGLPVCEIFNEEAVSDGLQSHVSESAIITSEGSSEQTHQTLGLPDVGNGEVHVHSETLVRTTELVPEVNSHPMSTAPPSDLVC